MKHFFKIFTLCIILALSCSSPPDSSQALITKMGDEIAEIGMEYKDLVSKIDPASINISEAQKNLLNVEYTEEEYNSDLYKYMQYKTGYSIILDLNETIETTQLLNSNFTIEFLKHSRIQTKDMGVKKFCVESMLQLIGRVKIGIEGLGIYFSNSPRINLFGEGRESVIENYAKVKTTIELIYSDMGNIPKDALDDEKKLNEFISKIQKSLEANIETLASSLESLAEELSEIPNSPPPLLEKSN